MTTTISTESARRLFLGAQGLLADPTRSTASITLSPNNGTTGQSVSANLMGLTGNTTYHFRVTGTNSVGPGRAATGSKLGRNVK